MSIFKKNKGITLISLIVTIIVLLILAGITINSITGSENAMEKATQSREENKLGEELEQIKLCVVNAMFQGLDAKVSAENLQTMLNGIVAQTEIEKVTGIGPWIIQGNSGREYKITNGGLVNAIDTMDKAIIGAISVEERSKVPIVISNGDNIEEIKSCTIADTSIATVAKDTDGIWKITGGTLTGNLEHASTTMSIEGKSGKKVENIVITLLKVTTAKDVIPIPTNSATSAYVRYAMNGQTEENAELCRVLYNDETHGLQIITANSVDNNVILGKNDNIGAIGSTNLERAQNSYNNAIVNLNNKAESYINSSNTIVSDARCIGSKSLAFNNTFTNKDDETDIDESTGHKGTDTNYTEDCNKMQSLSIASIYSSEYWLASRINNSSGGTFSIHNIPYYYNGLVNQKSLWGTNGFTGNPSAGFRPVFLINPTAKIKSGTETEQAPYILEAGE